MKKIINLAIIAIAIAFFSCESGESVSMQETQGVSEVQKTPQMQDFEQAFKGITMRMSESSAAKQRELDLIVQKCKLYLETNGQTYDVKATNKEIVSAALRLHAQKINELRTAQRK